MSMLDTYLKQLDQDDSFFTRIPKKLIWLSLLYAIGDLGYNLTGITIGKEATSTARAIAENMKITIIQAIINIPAIITFIFFLSIFHL